MVVPDTPALILAPMEGLTDAPMRAVQGELGAFTFAVSEFLRVSAVVPPAHVFHRHVPELRQGARTPSGLPVHVQLLGGDPGRMAEAAVVACDAGAQAVDINFGCPAPTVNRHDGGATLLKHPKRIREIVAAVRGALPRDVPVSAKLRLGWDSEDAIFENAAMAAEGGAAWLTIHGRTREQGYKPPALWCPIRVVRECLGIPVVANGDIWSLAAFRRCREETGCIHFMLGRGALADPSLSHQVARELGLLPAAPPPTDDTPVDWRPPLTRLLHWTECGPATSPGRIVCRFKQWLKIASLYGTFTDFESIKRAQSVEEIFTLLGRPVDRC
uniref:tRNA-dihydrouridine(16) synthase n=1 Tax=uncultured Armatimonadetes bacterium TaxID=157466 RepID=A0A6J4IZ93_9BACT|nr:tRNA-dihydrouridine(16) synthase [uncultured Armatimonadetes bacterium]